MIEDESFNAFLKGRLEEGVVVPEVKALTSGMSASTSAGRARVGLWLRPVLLAASVAVVCGLFSWQLVSARTLRLERRTAQTIEFLEEYEAEDLDVLPAEPVSSETFAERLLAWQDAPYSELEN